MYIYIYVERFFCPFQSFLAFGRNFWKRTEFVKISGISETVQENSEKTYGRKSAGKGRNSAGNGRKYPELQSQQKDVSRVKWTAKT